MLYSYDRRTAMEHATEEARKKYLRDHPNADSHHHTVEKGKDKGTKSTSSADHPAVKKGAQFWSKAEVGWRKLTETQAKTLKAFDGAHGGEAAKKYMGQVKDVVKNLEGTVQHYEESVQDSDNAKAKAEIKKFKTTIRNMKQGDDITANQPWAVHTINSSLAELSSDLSSFYTQYLHKMY
jgi:hypothetical protein